MLKKLGVQLYTIRDFMTTEQDIDQSYAKLASLGYTEAHTAGLPKVSDEAFANLAKKHGVKIIGTHYDYNRIVNFPDETMRVHKLYGTNIIGIGGMPTDARATYDTLMRFIEQFNAAAKIYARQGFKLSYHNHSFEFTRLDNGALIMDYLMENCPRLNVTLDTHWVHRGGVNVVDYIEKCKGRIECVHLKDYKMNMWDVKFAPVGKGNLDWTKILPAFEKAGVKYAFVEQDDAPDLGEPFDRLKESREFLTKMGY